MLMKKQSGFTLLELMIVMAIVGVALGIGLPTLSVYFQSSRMTNNSNAMVAAFQIAKSEAIKRQGPVTVCRSANQASCDLNDDNTWEDGFIVFLDVDADRVVDAGDGDILLRINVGAEDKLDPDAGTGSVTIRSDTKTNNEHQYVTFSSRGHPKNGRALQSAMYVVCDSRGIKGVTVDVDGADVIRTAARGVILSKSGKLRTTRDGTRLTTCAPL